MIPLSFDPKTAREMTGDEQSRAIEAKARADAEMRSWNPPKIDGATYADRLFSQMRQIVYREQYTRRLARNERK